MHLQVEFATFRVMPVVQWQHAAIVPPAAGVAVFLLFWLSARKAKRLETGLVVLTSGISLILLCSTMVTLTTGKMPVFMLAEPVILVAAIVGFILCLRKDRKGI